MKNINADFTSKNVAKYNSSVRVSKLHQITYSESMESLLSFKSVNSNKLLNKVGKFSMRRIKTTTWNFKNFWILNKNYESNNDTLYFLFWCNLFLIINYGRKILFMIESQVRFRENKNSWEFFSNRKLKNIYLNSFSTYL